MDRGHAAVYVCFGCKLGYFLPPRRGGPPRELNASAPSPPIDGHGADAQRSDPKVGDPSQFPRGRGPQGDDVRVLNYVRLVRDAGK